MYTILGPIDLIYKQLLKILQVSTHEECITLGSFN